MLEMLPLLDRGCLALKSQREAGPAEGAIVCEDTHGLFLWSGVQRVGVIRLVPLRTGAFSQDGGVNLIAIAGLLARLRRIPVTFAAPLVLGHHGLLSNQQGYLGL